jgi:uroporphyrinogen-III synthase
VERFFDEVPDARVLAGTKVAAVGPATARALAERRIVADLVPDEAVAESLLAAFPLPDADGERVLLARAAVARDVLPDGLRERGWEVDVVDAYRTVPGHPDPALLDRARQADAITFTSASTVANHLAVADRSALPPVIAFIGPVTAAAAREAGLDVTIEAELHTLQGLADALVAHFAAEGP